MLSSLILTHVIIGNPSTNIWPSDLIIDVAEELLLFSNTRTYNLLIHIEIKAQNGKLSKG